MNEENKKIKQENDRLRVLNRKLEQNMAEVVKKFEGFERHSNQVDLNNNAYSPVVNSMAKFSYDLKYKQILRD